MELKPFKGRFLKYFSFWVPKLNQHRQNFCNFLSFLYQNAFPFALSDFPLNSVSNRGGWDSFLFVASLCRFLVSWRAEQCMLPFWGLVMLLLEYFPAPDILDYTSKENARCHCPSAALYRFLCSFIASISLPHLLPPPAFLYDPVTSAFTPGLAWLLPCHALLVWVVQSVLLLLPLPFTCSSSLQAAETFGFALWLLLDGSVLAEAFGGEPQPQWDSFLWRCPLAELKPLSLQGNTFFFSS